jgi:hypothetical protein
MPLQPKATTGAFPSISTEEVIAIQSSTNSSDVIAWEQGSVSATLILPGAIPSHCPLSSTLLQALLRFEVFTAVTMKNGVFWDIKNLFVLHRRHITSPI